LFDSFLNLTLAVFSEDLTTAYKFEKKFSNYFYNLIFLKKYIRKIFGTVTFVVVLTTSVTTTVERAIVVLIAFQKLIMDSETIFNTFSKNFSLLYTHVYIMRCPSPQFVYHSI